MDFNCHKCHETDFIEGFDHFREVIFEKPQEITMPPEVENEICENCHVNNNSHWPQVANTSGHKTHFFDIDIMPDCVECHGSQIHVFEPPEEKCIECHEEELKNVNETMGTHCINCHEFTCPEHNLFPEREDCLECHKELPVDVSFPSGAHTDTDCVVCHNPHAEKQHAECTECHDVGVKGLHEEITHTYCIDCHTPHSSIDMRENCLTCHQDKKEHFAPTECVLCHSFS